MAMRVLITGSRSTAYPLDGVRRAFLSLAKAAKAAGRGGEPVVIVHGRCSTGVDDIAETVATQEFGWVTEPHPADWSRCSPLCKGKPANHRRINRREETYCTMAGLWRNQQMVNLHATDPYLMCLALPWLSWERSPGTYDCYKRAKKAGIETHAFDFRGELFINPTKGPFNGET